MSLFDPTQLRTERLLLDPIAVEDAPAVPALFADDPEVTRYVGWKPMTDETSARRFAEAEARAWVETDSCRGWMARRIDVGEVVGCVVARSHGASAEFSYVVDRRHWNRGYATEMARSIIERARNDPELAEIWAVCDVENGASRRVLEKAGMTLERRLPGHQRHNISEDPRDCVRFVLDVSAPPSGASMAQDTRN